MKTVTLDVHRKRFKTDKAAAADLAVDYMTYRRWRKRITFADTANRTLVAQRHVKLPERPEVKR